MLTLVHACRAPELMGVTAQASAKSNVWALGCILLEMHTGCTWPVGVVSARLHRRPANDGLPEPLADIILQCLHTKPHLRPSAADVTQVQYSGIAKEANVGTCKFRSVCGSLMFACMHAGAAAAAYQLLSR